jgi:hypothetical protein
MNNPQDQIRDYLIARGIATSQYKDRLDALEYYRSPNDEARRSDCFPEKEGIKP